MDITHEQLQNAFVLFMGCLFVFVLIRELICWYWKINKGILLQEKAIKNQEKIIELLSHQQGLDKFDRIYAGSGQPGGRGGDKL